MSPKNLISKQEIYHIMVIMCIYKSLTFIEMSHICHLNMITVSF